jgi:hypothetical protein
MACTCLRNSSKGIQACDREVTNTFGFWAIGHPRIWALIEVILNLEIILISECCEKEEAYDNIYHEFIYLFNIEFFKELIFLASLSSII